MRCNLRECPHCPPDDPLSLVDALANLAACLREAAGLCAAWNYGAKCASTWGVAMNSQDHIDGLWAPNVDHEPAPGFEGR